MRRNDLLPLLILSVAGCLAPRPTNEYYAAYDQASQLERENHADEAARGYAKTVEVAARPRTRDFAAYRQARQLEVAGRRDESLRLYLEIAERNPAGEMASRCLYYAGRIAFEDGDLETGLARMRRVIEEYHFKGLAPQAVRRAVQQLQEKQGDDAAIAFLREEEEKVRGTDIGDTILYRWAMLERDRDNWQVALERLERLDELYPYPGSTIWDDAMYQAGRIAAEHDEPHRALRYLARLVSWREDSLATGSYETTLTDDAQLLIGQIHLDQLRDSTAAAVAFEELATFTDSTLADDGLYWAARAHLEGGSTEQACRLLKRLLREFPYSNKQRQAREAFREQRCQNSSSSPAGSPSSSSPSSSSLSSSSSSSSS